MSFTKNVSKLKSTTFTELTTGAKSYYQNCYFYGACANSSGVTLFNRTYVTTCCQTDNCNIITIQPKVNSCFSGYSRTTKRNNQTVSDRKVAKTKCNSPKNQYCMSYFGSYMIGRVETFYNAYSCADKCVNNTDISLSTTRCCQTDDCNSYL